MRIEKINGLPALPPTREAEGQASFLSFPVAGEPLLNGADALPSGGLQTDRSLTPGPFPACGPYGNAAPGLQQTGPAGGSSQLSVQAAPDHRVPSSVSRRLLAWKATGIRRVQAQRGDVAPAGSDANPALPDSRAKAALSSPRSPSCLGRCLPFLERACVVQLGPFLERTRASQRCSRPTTGTSGTQQSAIHRS